MQQFTLECFTNTSPHHWQY